MIHHNFIVALLNDLFGIQSRGGCSCAGPYGARLLGIDMEHIEKLKELACSRYSSLKPGWFRLNFSFFFSSQLSDFIIDAVHFVANHGWKFMVFYKFDLKTGLWKCNQSDLLKKVLNHGAETGF
jgi:selenocysteine lyase/cysteine desulfurase